MKRIIVLFLAIMMVFTLIGCSKDKAEVEDSKPESENQEVSSGGEILIGCLQDTTGPTSTLGKMVEQGAAWAIEEINAKGGIDGKKIKMITYDTKGDVTEAINAYTRACSTDKVSAIIGPPVSNITLAIAPIAESNDVPVLDLSLDPNAHIKEDGTVYKNMFAFQPNALQQGKIMASYAMKNGFKDFGVIYNQANAYATSLLDPFIAEVEDKGGNIVESVAFNAQDKDFKTLLNKIVSQDVDAIYVPNYTQELILITQQVRALGFEGAIICGLDACPPFNTLLGEDADGVYYINNIDDTDPQMIEMIKNIKEKTGIDPTNKFFLGYDIAYILESVIKEHGTNPLDIQKALNEIKDFQGLTGNITIDPETHMPTGLEMVMFTYEGTTPIKLERYSAD